jgi:hypothetical protein
MTILTRQSHPTRSSSHSGAEQVLYFVPLMRRCCSILVPLINDRRVSLLQPALQVAVARRRFCSILVPLMRRCCGTVVPLMRRCCRCCSAVVLLMRRCCRRCRCCSTTNAQVLRHCSTTNAQVLQPLNWPSSGVAVPVLGLRSDDVCWRMLTYADVCWRGGACVGAAF